MWTTMRLLNVLVLLSVLLNEGINNVNAAETEAEAAAATNLDHDTATTTEELMTGTEKLRHLLLDFKDEPGFVRSANLEFLDASPQAGQKWVAWIHSHINLIMEQLPGETRYVIPKPDAQEYMDIHADNVDVIDCQDAGDLRHALSTPKHVANIIGIQNMPLIQPKLVALEETLERGVQDADFYIAQPNAGSYGWHFDKVDNLVYCVNGTKRFRVAGTQPGSDVLVDVNLQPGDAIYVPAGHYHIGVGGTTSSMIWSIGLREKHWESPFDDDDKKYIFKKKARKHLLIKKELQKLMVEKMFQEAGRPLSWEEVGMMLPAFMERRGEWINIESDDEL